LVTLSGSDHSHVFPEDHLILVSKANKNKWVKQRVLTMSEI
jgi:hypothetical protein